MSRLGDSLQRLREGVGFQMDEMMSGEHELEPGFGEAGPRRLELRLTWGTRNVVRWLTPGGEEFLRGPLVGALTADGLCQDAPCQGTLELRYFDEHKIRYSFEFEAQGRRHRFVGEKVNIRPWNLPFSHATCFGRITEVDSGRLVSTSVTRFRLTTLPRFLLSFRVTGEGGPTTPA
ncbi:MAG: hypothetical protein HY901_18525 [Deltaproteobacteria bacterium]|nr:hypothetical protein [Deltaproteobacteria bacterium]